MASASTDSLPPLPSATKSPVIKKGGYARLKSALLPSLNDADSAEPTVVVAMAAAAARVGAAMDENATAAAGRGPRAVGNILAPDTRQR